MENHADPMHINISTNTRALLDETFVIRERGLVDVKGKGPMEMFYVDDALLASPVLIGEDSPASSKVGIGAIFSGATDE